MIATEQVEKLESGRQQTNLNKAFVAAGRKVGELTLLPYSASREAAADVMKLHFGTIGESGRQMYIDSGMYPGLKRDIVIVMWLCAKATEEEIDAAGMNGLLSARIAMEWGKKFGLFDTRSDLFTEAYNAFFDIMHDTWASRTKAQKKTDSPETGSTSLEA
jgi:hypothetical protein